MNVIYMFPPNICLFSLPPPLIICFFFVFVCFVISLIPPLLFSLHFLSHFLSFVCFLLFREKMYPYYHHPYPCLHCHPHSYIRMVQHLIERCLLLRMSRDQCIKALADHARIQPLVTLTVWRELLKENRDFFHGYFHVINSPRPFISRQIQKKARFARRKLWR